MLTANSRIYRPPSNFGHLNKAKRLYDEGVLLQKQGKVKEAVGCLKKAREEMEANFTTDLYFKGRLLRDLGRFLLADGEPSHTLEAYQCFRTAFGCFRAAGRLRELDTLAKEVRRAERVLKQIADQKKGIKWLCEKAGSLQDKKDLESASFFAEEAVKAVRECKVTDKELKANAYLQRGLVRAKLNQREAYSDLRRAARYYKDHDKKQWPNILVWQYIAASQEHLTEEVTTIRRQLQEDPDFPESLRRRLESFFRLHPREEKDVTDGVGTGEEHDHPVDSDADTPSGSHSLADCFEKLFI